MTGLLDPQFLQIEPPRKKAPTIITLAFAAAILVGAALKYAPASTVGSSPTGASMRPNTVEDVMKQLAEHQQEMIRSNREHQEALEGIKRGIERLCIVMSVNAGARPEDCAR